MLTTLCGLACSALVSFFLFRSELKEAEPIPQANVNYNHLCNNIDLLNTLKTELQNTENMIIDIEMFSESDLTNITVSNDKYNCSVLVNNRSDLLKQLYKQRDILRKNITSLLSEMTVKS